MVDEARLEETPSGLAPTTEGWFVVNVREAAWTERPGFATSCRFEGAQAPFTDLGINIRVLEPGRPNGLYHTDSCQEDFLVLAGECVLLIEGEERRLSAWDFVHCPPNAPHIFVGAGSAPCVILMVGARRDDRVIGYPVSEFAARYGASAETETDSPAEAYASYPSPRDARPASWERLPWA
jgi:uncharacterized cupin superfamily protein